MVFNNSIVQFEINNALVEGVLNGDITFWEFRSNSYEFTKLFKEGVFSNRISFKEMPEPLEKMIDKLYETLEEQFLKNSLVN